MQLKSFIKSKVGIEIIISILLLIAIPSNSFSQQGWFSQSPPPPLYGLNDIHVFDARTAMAVGDRGTVAKTTDSGVNWDIQYIGSNKDLYSAGSVDASTAWGVGGSGDGIILRTDDGGAFWNMQDTNTSGTKKSLLATYFFDESTGWAVGVDGTIVKTTNGGQFWDTQQSGTNRSLHSTYFVNPDTATQRCLFLPVVGRFSGRSGSGFCSNKKAHFTQIGS